MYPVAGAAEPPRLAQPLRLRARVRPAPAALLWRPASAGSAPLANAARESRPSRVLRQSHRCRAIAPGTRPPAPALHRVAPTTNARGRSRQRPRPAHAAARAARPGQSARPARRVAPRPAATGSIRRSPLLHRAVRSARRMASRRPATRRRAPHGRWRLPAAPTPPAHRRARRRHGPVPRTGKVRQT